MRPTIQVTTINLCILKCSSWIWSQTQYYSPCILVLCFEVITLAPSTKTLHAPKPSHWKKHWLITLIYCLIACACWLNYARMQPTIQVRTIDLCILPSTQCEPKTQPSDLQSDVLPLRHESSLFAKIDVITLSPTTIALHAPKPSHWEKPCTHSMTACAF